MSQSLFRSWKGWISVLAVSAVPLLYSAAYLSAFWNPYGHLNQIPIAVVNQDQGVQGKQFVHQMAHRVKIMRETLPIARNALNNGQVGIAVM